MSPVPAEVASGLHSVHDPRPLSAFGRGARVAIGAVVAAVVMALAAQPASAAPWTCDSFGYLFQAPGGAGNNDVFRLDLATGTSTPLPMPGTDALNAVGFNSLDNYFYGWDPTINQIVRIENDRTFTPVGLPPGVNPAPAYNVGDIDPSGHYWMTLNEGAWYEIDLAPGSPTFGTVLRSGSVSYPNVNLTGGADWSYVNGFLYRVAHNANTRAMNLIRFNPATNTQVNLGQLGFTVAAGGGGAVGATFVDAQGRMYFSDNLSGRLFRVDVNSARALFVATGPATLANDGARCASAPIPTIRVTKTVAGRLEATDQFTVALAGPGGGRVASATTAGAATTAATDDFPVSQGATYTITDAMAAGSASAVGAYESSIACTDMLTGSPAPTGGSPRNWTLIVARATYYACTVTNAPPPPQPPPAPRTTADLSITKTPSSSLVEVGGQVLYTLTVRNHGPDDATGVTVHDQALAGLTLLAAEPSRGRCDLSAQSLTCTLGAVAVGGSGQVLVTARADVAGTLTNTATVTGDQPDPDPPDNTTPSTITVVPPPLPPVLPPAPPLPPPAPPSPPVPPTPPAPPTPPQPSGRPVADLVLVKRVNRAAVTSPDRIRFTVTVTNRGPDAAPNARIIDTSTLAVRVISVKPSSGACVRRMPLTCELGAIDAGGRARIRILARPRDAGRLRNAASATSPATDPNTENNMDRTTTRTYGRLRVRKTADRAQVRPGGRVRYRIAVRNANPFALDDVRVCDRLPWATLTATSRPRTRLRNGRLCWTIHTLAPRRSRTFQVVVRTHRDASGVMTNRAVADSPDTRRVVARRRTTLPGGACPAALTTSRGASAAMC